jgi:hypothetical protein
MFEDTYWCPDQKARLAWRHGQGVGFLQCDSPECINRLFDTDLSWSVDGPTWLEYGTVPDPEPTTDPEPWEDDEADDADLSWYEGDFEGDES